MTLKDAITKFDAVCRNNIPAEIKVDWLSELDSSLHKEVFLTHENPFPTFFTPYNRDTPEDTILLIEDPYSNVYLKYLAMKKDLYYSDISRYNNDLALFTAAYADFENYYNSRHKHIKNVDYFNA